MTKAGDIMTLENYMSFVSKTFPDYEQQVISIIHELYPTEFDGLISEGKTEKNAFTKLFAKHKDDIINLQNGPKTLENVSEAKREFIWYPYIPLSEYTVLFADSGIGKSYACLAIAAALSKGECLPGETACKPPRNTLYITSEDDASDLKYRLRNSGADFNRIHYLDRESSLGIDFSLENIDTLRFYIESTEAKLVIIDPWQAFIGANVNTNAQNEMRTVLQRISVLAKQTGCAIILLSHVNKRERRENINNAATGSAELINACRSALTILYENSFTEETRNIRLLVHTKSSHAAPGETIRFDLSDGIVKWAGFSDVDRWTVDFASSNKMNLQDAAAKQRRSRSDFSDLKRVICQLAAKIPDDKSEIRILYSDIEDATEKGVKIWNAPANAAKIDKSGAIASIKSELAYDYGIFISFPKDSSGNLKSIRSDINKKKNAERGIILRREENEE